MQKLRGRHQLCHLSCSRNAIFTAIDAFKKIWFCENNSIPILTGTKSLFTIYCMTWCLKYFCANHASFLCDYLHEIVLLVACFKTLRHNPPSCILNIENCAEREIPYDKKNLVDNLEMLGVNITKCIHSNTLIW